MSKDKHPGAGASDNSYNKPYFMKKFGISETEVLMSLREIRYGTPEELEDYLKLKAKNYKPK